MRLVLYQGLPHVVVRQREDWGISVFDLTTPIRRLWTDLPSLPPILRTEVDTFQAPPIPSPAELMISLPTEDNWSAMTRRSLARLEALCLIVEDPQRRLEVREVETLAHQVSLVRHVLDNAKLRRVLIADEVGLGKTVEAAMILQELLARDPGLRVLYLAPARLVSNVGREFRRMGLAFREWKAQESDANLEKDQRIIASIHRAVHPNHVQKFKTGRPWDVIVVDECHHLSDWAPGGGDPVEKYRLVRDLVAGQRSSGHLLLLSGTPHQANVSRFENLLKLLLEDGEKPSEVAGRVIFRTKEDVRDWNDHPLFPKRQVNPPIVCDISPEHRQWLGQIQEFFSPPGGGLNAVRQRAAGWRCAQALQWATSSPNAGLGYLVRQAVRDGWMPSNPVLRNALAAIRPYRRGRPDEHLDELYQRLQKEVHRQREVGDLDDLEDLDAFELQPLERQVLSSLLVTGTRLVVAPDQPKWQVLWDNSIANAGGEKVVLFAQPIETVLALAGWLQNRTGSRPAIIIGGQSDAERDAEVARFRSPSGPQFLISSRAGGEGINLQFARRLVHLDVPWNPMDMEQRVGRVHRFGSKRTILVDTLIVRDSREERMWAVARQRLETISRTMVSRDRFETLFSRVMCLIAPEDLQKVMLDDTDSTMGPELESRLSHLVEAGFRSWQSFHDQFAQNQRLIRQMPAGLSRWEDLEDFLIRHAGAERQDGVMATRFREAGGTVTAEDIPARVLKLSSGEYGLVGDYSGNPISGGSGIPVKRLGLNMPEVLTAIRELALPRQPTGAALLRWGDAEALIRNRLGRSATVWAFLRQNLQFDQTGGANEMGAELHLYVSSADFGTTRPLNAEERQEFLRSLGNFSTRIKPTHGTSDDRWLGIQTQLMNELTRPSERELANRIRHAVWPLLVARIED
jgi:superfamily II DNA or RNA helicase